MDIGGGSVEFIIADKTQVYWAQSFPVGVAVLYRQFQHHDPISASEVTAIQQFLQQQLSPLQEVLQDYPSSHLVGAAGTFDVVADHLSTNNSSPQFAPIALDKFEAFYGEVLSSTQQERYDMPGIPSDRADMIVVALILIDLILKMADIKQLTVSFYAMKEGMLSELMEISRSEE
jgi:exopolyphosphatase/guanosine-5'-triphosphate,3'-diphosphate pyrophosphatase